jgi:hypothetical protein
MAIEIRADDVVMPTRWSMEKSASVCVACGEVMADRYEEHRHTVADCLEELTRRVMKLARAEHGGGDGQ